MAIVEVKSEKNPDVVYHVNTETGECDCPHYQKRLKEQNAGRVEGDHLYCKHYDGALIILANRGL